MKASFVMPVRNCVAWVNDSIHDILNQSLSDIELLIIDDASTDGTQDLLQYMAVKNDRIRLELNKTRKGAAWCRNRMNAQVNSDIILVADGGDRYHVDRASDAYELFRLNPDIDIYATGVIVINELGEQLYGEVPKYDAKPGEKPSISHPTMVYRKEVAAAVKYNEESVETDQYERFILKCAEHNFKFAFTNAFFVSKRENTDRNLKEAHKFKKKTYQDYNIKIPEFIQNA